MRGRLCVFRLTALPGRRILAGMHTGLDLLALINQLPQGATAIMDGGRIYGLALFEVPNSDIRIDVLEMGFNWRVVETELPDCYGYRRFWCFPKSMKIEEVVAAAREWGGAEDSEPVGWIKTHSWGRRPLRERIGGYLAEQHLQTMGKVAHKLPLVAR